MSFVVRVLERSLVSALEPVVRARAQRSFKCFARNILQTTTAGMVESGPTQGFAVAAAVTHTQPAVLPQLPLRAEATRRVNVRTVATSTDRTNTRRRAKPLDLRESLGRPQHKQSRFP